LLAHVPHHNGRVGAWGSSYAGFLATMSALSRHAALVVASPQAPATDSYFEDFHHNGALTQGYFYGYPIFGIDPPGPTKENWWLPKMITDGTANDYAFQLALGPLANTTEKYYKDNRFWQDIITHPNYDAYWQSRAVPPVLTGIHSAILIAGGWFDAENLYGTLATYKTLTRQDTAAKARLVMGPFRHNGWEATDDSLATTFQREVEAPYFRAYLKGDGKVDLPAALLFDTGRQQWRRFTSWPAREATTRRYYFHADSSLSPSVPTETHTALSYVSDPAQPVPSRCHGPTIEDGTLYHYMSDDQRCYETRPDVVTFQTAPLTQDVTLGGEIWARLNVSTTGTDADYVVKLIDVDSAGNAPLVRGEIMRARFRQSFAVPKPMRPDVITPVSFQLQDVLHTFRVGHRIMVQVHSTWFPAFDRNPQAYVPNIYQAAASDFVKATERVWVDRAEPSYLEVQVVP
jgi:putative CocE/NonD family hydrolase